MPVVPSAQPYGCKTKNQACMAWLMFWASTEGR
jgi:hypothetical protein